MKGLFTAGAILASFALAACASDGQQSSKQTKQSTQSTQTASAQSNAKPGTPPDGALSGEEIRSAYAGGRYYGSTPSGKVFILDYMPDGKMVGIVPKERDTGQWWVEGNQICRKWNRWAERKPQECFFVVMTPGNANWYRNDGSLYRAWRRN